MPEKPGSLNDFLAQNPKMDEAAATIVYSALLAEYRASVNTDPVIGFTPHDFFPAGLQPGFLGVEVADLTEVA